MVEMKIMFDDALVARSGVKVFHTCTRDERERLFDGGVKLTF